MCPASAPMRQIRRVEEGSDRPHREHRARLSQMALEKYEHHFSPEELVGFIYAVLHAPTYRAKYAEFLRTGLRHVISVSF
jgi:predicted helicase